MHPAEMGIFGDDWAKVFQEKFSALGADGSDSNRQNLAGLFNGDANMAAARVSSGEQISGGGSSGDGSNSKDRYASLCHISLSCLWGSRHQASCFEIWGGGRKGHASGCEHKLKHQTRSHFCSFSDMAPRRRYKGSASSLDVCLALLEAGTFFGDWAQLGRKARTDEIIKHKALIFQLHSLSAKHGPFTQQQLSQGLLRADQKRKLTLQGWNKTTWANDQAKRLRAALRFVSQASLKESKAVWMRILMAEGEDRQPDTIPEESQVPAQESQGGMQPDTWQEAFGEHPLGDEGEEEEPLVGDDVVDPETELEQEEMEQAAAREQLGQDKVPEPPPKEYFSVLIETRFEHGGLQVMRTIWSTRTSS